LIAFSAHLDKSQTSVYSPQLWKKKKTKKKKLHHSSHIRLIKPVDTTQHPGFGTNAKSQKSDEIRRAQELNPVTRLYFKKTSTLLYLIQGKGYFKSLSMLPQIHDHNDC
jgi:hypothetical protein